MTKVRVCFECDKSSAKTIVALILDRISNLRMEEVETAEPKTNKTRSTAWVETHGRTVLEYFRTKGGEINYQDHGLIATVEKSGLKGTSTSSLLSDLVNTGKLVRVRAGTYRLAPQ